MRMFERLHMTTALCQIGACTVMVFYGAPALANPQGGKVVAGNAAIVQSGKKTDIRQSSQRAVIDWRKFDIAADEHTQFHQPSKTSVTLNRVGDEYASVIAGKLSANGNVIIANPNGVVFTKDAKVDVNGLVATTADISNRDFMAGKMKFDKPGKPDAAIINEGHITAREAGLVGLVAPNVLNHGVIEAKMGRVQLASGDAVTVDLYGDGLMEIKVSDEVKSQLVSNAGHIVADGGNIALTAAAGGKIVNSLILAGGEMKAPTTAGKQGKISVYAEGSNAVRNNDAALKGKKSGNSTVVVQGYMDVSGRDAGEQGGKVEVLGDNIAVMAGSFIDASGHSAKKAAVAGNGSATMTAQKVVRSEKDFLAHGQRAGGSIKIGGDYLGKGKTPAAKNLYVEDHTLVANDATHSGDGGRTIFWSDDRTDFHGGVFSRGGAKWGNGGFLETSGKGYLQATGFADLSAVKGNKGTYLLDPADITIYGNFAPDYQSTDGSIDLSANLHMWFDAADPDSVILSYTDEGWGTTASGAIGTNTISMSIDKSFQLAVGSRVRLGGAGVDAAASTLGADTYTITAVNGTELTVDEPLTANYVNAGFYRSRVAQWNDKANGNHAVQAAANARPHWISGGANVPGGTNGLDTIVGNPNEYLTSPTGLPMGQSSLFTAFNIRSSSGTQGLIGTGAAQDTNPYLLLQENSGMLRYLNEGSGAYVNVGAVSTGANYLFSQVSNGTARALYLSAEEKYNDPDDLSSPFSGNNAATNLFSGWNSEFKGWIHEIISYNVNLDDVSRQLVEQYQAARWGIDLLPPGTGATEAARAMASDGYSSFTTRYLERLSQSADIVLQADNTITLDLKGDTLALDAGRSITLTTTNGDISTASAGTIETFNGDIIFTAGGTGDINIDHALTLTAGGNGDVVLTANLAGGGDINVNAPLNYTGGYMGLFADAGDIVVNAAITETAGGKDLYLEANDFDINAALTGTGELSFANATTGRTVAIGDGAVGDNNIDSTSLNNIGNGWTEVTFIAFGGDVNLTAHNWDNDVVLDVGLADITIDGTQNFGAHNFSLGNRASLFINAPLIGSGILEFHPYGSSGTDLFVGDLAIANNYTGATYPMLLTEANLAQVQDGWSEIRIAARAGNIYVESSAPLLFSDPVTFAAGGEIHILSDVGFTAASDGSVLFEQSASAGNPMDLVRIAATIDTRNGMGGITLRNMDALELDGASLLTGDQNITFENSVASASLTGDATLNAGNATISIGTGGIDLSTDLLSLQSAALTLNGDVTGSGDLTIYTDAWGGTGDLLSATGDLFTFAPYTAADTLAVGTGGAMDYTLADARITEIQTGFGRYAFGRADGGNVANYTAAWGGDVTFLSGGNWSNEAASTTTGVFLVDVDGDVTLNGTLTANGNGNALVLSAGGNFLNNAGTNALDTPTAGARWLVYSSDPSLNNRDDLMPDASDFNKTYAANAPATIGAGNRLIYSLAVAPTITYDIDDATMTQGDPFAGSSVTYVGGVLGVDGGINDIGITGSPAYATNYNNGDPAGNYNITATTGTFFSPLGYQFAFNAGDLTVLAGGGGGGGGGGVQPPAPTPPAPTPVPPGNGGETPGGGNPPAPPASSPLPNSVEHRMQRPDDDYQLPPVEIAQLGGNLQSLSTFLSIDPRLAALFETEEE